MCDDYLTYSVADSSVVDRRSRDMLCQDLRAATKQARSESLKIGLRLGPIVRHGARADVEVVLTRDEVPTSVTMHLARVGGHWRVVRDVATCGSLGCP